MGPGDGPFGPDIRRCRETTELHAAGVLLRGVRRPAPATVYHTYILYVLQMYNRAICRNEANSSELSGFPGLSAEFFPTILIFHVDSERRQAAQRPHPPDLTAAPFHPSKSPQGRSQLAITSGEIGAVISLRLLTARISCAQKILIYQLKLIWFEASARFGGSSGGAFQSCAGTGFISPRRVGMSSDTVG